MAMMLHGKPKSRDVMEIIKAGLNEV